MSCKTFPNQCCSPSCQFLVFSLGTHAMLPAETTMETAMTDTTATEMTTMETTTMETTTETTTPPTTTAPNITISKNTSSNGTETSVSSNTTAFPATGNTTNFQSSNSSAGNATANSTAVPISSSTAVSHANASANSSNWVPPFSTNTTNSSSMVPTSPTGGGMVVPTSSTKGNGSSGAQVVPTWKTSVTVQGSTAPRQTPTAVLGSSSSPNPSKATVQMLLRVLLSFRILNRSFNESLRDPTSKEYRSLSHTVLTMFESVFGCASCMSRQTYKGCSELRFSEGSVEVQSTLVFGHGNGTITSDAAEQQLRNSLDQNNFIMGLQLASIQSTVEVTSPAPVPVVPDWAIALLVLVCILLLLSILTCLLLTTCTCHRKSRGKLDLFSTKDSYHPMAEYPPYQSHGRYVSPNSKPNPYSQVAGSNGTVAGTFNYTAATSDNL
ncbi:mucin-1 isoform X1 [Mycteria americana]|uniref:mucin-1 isoform X1 n=1 Tax=Mycteria americana TaxID=33587 RepID=UPI003F58E98D